MIFYFSGTGNTRWVARRLADALHEPMHDMCKELTCYQPAEGERIGFLFPVYGWGLPEPVRRFIKGLQLTGHTYLYMVCTCGDDIGRTAHLFRQLTQARGWTCKAFWSVIMPNTYVCLPGFDVDTPEVVRQKVDCLPGRLQTIASGIRQQVSAYDCHDGKLPYTKTYVLGTFFRWFLMSARPFRVTPQCVACGRCIKACPMHNLHENNGHPCWGDRCTVCLACYHICPHHAIAYGQSTRHKGQYDAAATLSGAD